MADIRSPKLLLAKGILFLLLGCLAGGMLLADHPTWRTGVLLVLTIWAFCRAYYFAFYVVERYIDSRFKFAGLSSVLKYLLTHQSSTGNTETRSSD